MSDGFGFARVLEPIGSAPQPAWRLDNTPVCREGEMLLDVETLNVDAASFLQMKTACSGVEDCIAQRILELVERRGKLHNPETDSGGMLVGRVRQIHPESSRAAEFKEGDRIATLVSLSVTPLLLRRIHRVYTESGQVSAEGTAVLFAAAPCAKMPDDLPDRVALAVLDVCGAPAQVSRLVRPGQTVAVIGAGGKSGLLSLAQARRNLGGPGSKGRVVALEYAENSAKTLEGYGAADVVRVVDARDPFAARQALLDASGGREADVVVNCASVPGTELASILMAKERGAVCFFSMATRFAAAALGAEGLGKDVDLLIGNGYATGHAQLALNLVRSEGWLRKAFVAKVYKDDGRVAQ